VGQALLYLDHLLVTLIPEDLVVASIGGVKGVEETEIQAFI